MLVGLSNTSTKFKNSCCSPEFEVYLWMLSGSVEPYTFTFYIGHRPVKTRVFLISGIINKECHSALYFKHILYAIILNINQLDLQMETDGMIRKLSNHLST